jgi:hypothetical protein
MTLSIMELCLIGLGRMTTNRTPISRPYLIVMLIIIVLTVSNMCSPVGAQNAVRLPAAMLVKKLNFAPNVYVLMHMTKRMF